MISTAQLGQLHGATVRESDGDKIGKVTEVYESSAGAHEGTFVTVSTGLFGGKDSFIPLADAHLDGEDLVVPYSKDVVEDAPRVEADEELTDAEEARIYSHYNLGASTGTSAGTATTGTAAAAAPTAATGQTATDGAEVTLSEEQLQVGTRTQESGRARLRKYVTSETQTQTVPVSHEEVVVSREPIAPGDTTATAGTTELGEGETEIVLTEEVPVVTTETVPVEKVTVGTRTVTDEQTVSADVRKEHIDLDETTQAPSRQ